MALQNLDPRQAHDWVQLLIVDTIFIVIAIFSFWKWLIAPLEKKIKKEYEDRESALKRETEERKIADQHRDEKQRELRDVIHSTLGRVEVMERSLDRAADDRKVLHEELDHLKEVQVQDSTRVREVQLQFERSMGDVKTAMAQMENRLLVAVQSAVREAAKNRGG